MYSEDRVYTREHLLTLAVNYSKDHPDPRGPVYLASEWEKWVTESVEGDTSRPNEFGTLLHHTGLASDS